MLLFKTSLFYFIYLFLFCFKFNSGYGIIRHSDEIVLKIKGGFFVAQLLAQQTGHYFKGAVNGFDDTYIFIPMENVYPNHYYKRGMTKVNHLVNDERVLWAEPQTVHNRQKRDYTLSKKNRKIYKKPLHSYKKEIFNDELWSKEWYLQDTRSRQDLPKLDLNVLPLYKEGISGKGVRITILDDGIEYTHDDLKDNYDPNISYDCNEEDNDPLPRYEPNRINSHGTRCAGEIAMTANNGKCGVGIAFNAKIGGVKLLDGIVTDRIEGTALSYARDLVDIYSASWGPNDDGKTVDGPGRLGKEALEKGVKEGRNGKGSIFVWASGNGGSKNDNCNCDGYLTSPYTISIGSASQKGEFPWYGEACASTLAVTYSSGAYSDQMIATTDLYNECTVKHTGTSASAPLAAGIIALALEINPNLTWRDVQHLIAWTSEMAPLQDNSGWQKNSVGLWFNSKFGFGLMNAYGLAKMAVNWSTIEEQNICTIEILPKNKTITYGKPTLLKVFSNTCGGTKNEVNYLEHVELKTSITYPIRGVLEVYLVSPSGSKVQLLSKRKFDTSDKGFTNWTFMSVMTWGEFSKGLWSVIIQDNVGPVKNIGFVKDTTLILHGTKHLPNHMKNGPRLYNNNYNKFTKSDNIYNNIM